MIKATKKLVEENLKWKRERIKASRKHHNIRYDHFYICNDCDQDWESTHRMKECTFCKSKNIERTNIEDDK